MSEAGPGGADSESAARTGHQAPTGCNRSGANPETHTERGMSPMSNNTTGSIAERVAAGARLLDDREPGWRGRIDLDRLEMADVHRCVLGQLYGSYERGRTRLLPRVLVADDQAAAHGFDTYWAGESKWDDLDAAWRALIEQRQTGGAS